MKNGGECAILPFAQEDMVTTFMNGIDPSLLVLIDNYLKQLFKRLPELLTGDDVPEEIKKNHDYLHTHKGY